VTCDEVREQLADHLLGTLDEVTDAAVRSHLRSCGSCRREMATVAEGIATFSRAAHEVEPPAELRDRVLGALGEEWRESTPEPRRRSARPWIASAVAAAAVVASLGWGMTQAGVAERYERNATKYEAFLHALGGKNVRVGVVRSAGEQQIEGSAVLYDSDVEQSWALILVRAPGMTGQADVGLSSSSNGKTIPMHPLDFSDGGESSTWLVTSANIESFDTVTITGPTGDVLATAAVRAG
jgi:hypothetical protein